MRYEILSTLLRALGVMVILRVLGVILSNYPDYFPPNFDALFLLGREATFHGVYRVAFYTHILSAPIVLFTGLILLSARVRRWHARLHRSLGWVYVIVLLTLMMPSSVIMSRQAYGGWSSGLSFLLLSVATASCAVMGIIHARRRRYDRHRRWMLRSFVLICSAVALRIISGAAETIAVPSPEGAYVVAAWCSWLIPLTVYELVPFACGTPSARIASSEMP